MKLSKTFLTLLLMGCSLLSVRADFSIHALQVEYQTTPLGIDEDLPRFSWQMQADDTERGYRQTAYRIVVTDENRQEVWDSEKVSSDQSLNIYYEGQPLEATTQYHWTVTVWDQDGAQQSNTSWFETGLMNSDPKLPAWNGATWIGGRDDDQVFYPHYLSVFKLEYSLALDAASGSTRAAFVFGGNDQRLMDRDLNMQAVENGKDESYIAFELDISDLNDGSGPAKFNIYRVGYIEDDRADVPWKSIDIPADKISNWNKYEAHHFYVDNNFGLFEIFLDGREPADMISEGDQQDSPFAMPGMNINPVGRGHDYISFPMLGDIGFRLPAGQQAAFTDIAIRHYRYPSNVIYTEEPGAAYRGTFSELAKNGSGLEIEEGSFQLNGGEDGVLLLADPSRNAVPMLRTEFTTGNKTVKKARLYATARGIYELYLNGERVGEDYFNPGLTQYNKTHMYQTYDVTDLMRSGGNALGAWLSEGWWSGNITYTGDNWNFFGDRQSLLCQLIITFEDGTEQVIASNPYDQNWKYFNDGPIRYGSFFQGEVYDARKEAAIEGWSTAAYDDADWTAAVEVPLEGNSYIGTFDAGRRGQITFDYDDLKIMGQVGKNAGIAKILTPVSVEEVRPGVYVYDMGQNMVGFPRIELPAGPAGETVTLRYAEVRYPDLPEYSGNIGMIMLENIRAALTQDVHIRKGGAEVIQPRFTFHGFRFLEITGIDEALPLESVQGLVISSIDELASNYETSNELVNKLWENITWSMRGNFLSIPTDTPARNERMGWSGDISVFSRASTYLASVNQFLRRHLLAMRDIQREDGRFTDVAPVGGGFGGTLWGSAGIVVAWETYQQFGDLELLREHYDAMKDYVAYLGTRIDEETNILNEGPLGDWLSPEGNKNDNTLLWTAYHAYDLEILAKTAELLGKTADAREFRRQYEERKAFFNATYVDPQSHKTVKSGLVTAGLAPPGETREETKTDKGELVDTQASYAIPLALGIFNEDHKPQAVKNLVAAIERENTDDSGVRRPSYSLMTGFIGTASLMQALSDNGEDDVAYRMLQQETYPSWLYSVVNGATTIWERLNSYTVENGFGGNNRMNSFNHYSFGAVAAWMYNYSLGIQRDPKSPGFKHFILQPTPDPTGKMKFAEGYYDSMYGTIRSAWSQEGKTWTYTVSVPGNTTATLYLPAASAKKVREQGKKLKKAKGIEVKGLQGDRLEMTLASGTYEFTIRR
ncbi:family 78 glycoside hydrolase catalytic domain [Flavilitoribacter nigricans]|uniref:alpha-L-rhamnosidase n=1 Tax=Flavilitoribacter nigricans (strain ATCC 23147 / DSM 23189 / NBRC 102662 / NCIMB 1420 / SS-2) TaxID=1122177 RepID=A0A2D0MY42_FLAN2|nr:family 78 glycoside hydrolase catalytic domain [Flavilitoribacter nigricans]PHN01100.1 alpha-L-rhamnosidase [Flavilitoribacter nigricans DSM 23189 = NBRC 102662]